MNKETKTSKSFWATAFESEISTLFDASEKSNIITNIVAINEIGLTFKSDGKKNEFIYDIIYSIIPELIIPDDIPTYSEKNSKVKSIIRTVEQHLYEDFFCLTYKCGEKGIFNDNYQPKLIYTDKIGKEKVIPTFSDLFLDPQTLIYVI